MADTQRPELVLASASGARRRLLEAAGLAFRVVPADVDEAAIKRGLAKKHENAEGVVEALARAKAVHVSASLPEALVIGADQVLALGEELFDKPRDRAEARAQLMLLRGKTHRLWCGMSLAVGSRSVWHSVDCATLSMRGFSEAFLDGYLDAAGPAVMSSVGGYELEGLGIQLFERVDGDFFTILGLPLLPLLTELRARGAIDS